MYWPFTEQKADGQEVQPGDSWSIDAILKDRYLEREQHPELPPSQPMNDVGYSLLIR